MTGPFDNEEVAPSAAQSSHRGRKQERKATKRGLLPLRTRTLAGVGTDLAGLSLVTALTATVVVPSGPVAADQVSDLSAQAAQIAKDLVLQQLEIGAYQQQVDVDVARVQQDQAAIAVRETKIQADGRHVSRDRKRIEAEAVWAYIHGDPKVNATEALFEGNQNQTLARAQYEDVVGGDITFAIDTLHIDERNLGAERALLEQKEAQDQTTTNQEETAANAAQQTEVSLEATQSQIKGRLAVAVAQQQAAEAAAAAAAVRAAQAAAAARAQAAAAAAATAAAAAAAAATTTLPASPTTASPTTTNAPRPAAPPPSTASGNPALPPFLQCALQAESSGNFGAVSPNGQFLGGFQFLQSTWNEAAQMAGMPQLIGVPPNVASPADQEDLAIALFQADGEQPWADPCRTG